LVAGDRSTLNQADTTVSFFVRKFVSSPYALPLRVMIGGEPEANASARAAKNSSQPVPMASSVPVLVDSERTDSANSKGERGLTRKTEPQRLLRQNEKDPCDEINTTIRMEDERHH
jgi:hypothetical protein